MIDVKNEKMEKYDKYKVDMDENIKVWQDGEFWNSDRKKGRIELEEKVY